jgi:serine/threonine-protein kinase
MASDPPGDGVDRNVLFAVLAYRTALIARDMFVSAVRAWAADKESSVGQALVERGALTADQRGLIESLVRTLLTDIGGGGSPTPGALQLSREELRDLESITDPDIDRLLRRFRETRPCEETGDWAPGGGSFRPTQAPTGRRFRHVRLHAQGGLGEVYLARDEELNREVALKEIKALFADDASSRARFVLEAEVTGGLEHPGIVPVYGMGRYEDGRPYYAMRMIQGESLDAAIRRSRGVGRAGDGAGEEAMTLRGLLGRFVDVCEAVSYAHSRGVLHRDLKPSNVMVGKFGETIVLDWGLAKTASRSDDRPEGDPGAGHPSGDGSGVATRPGSVLGTPAYMSPEQAAGELDRVGVATDVYGLGATLYAILTGRPPVRERRGGAAPGESGGWVITPPRRVKADVPRALEMVCLKAMAREPGDRYGSASALASEVEHWLADEPVSAWREPLTTRLARWARSHKTLVTGVLISLTAAAVTSVAGLVFVNEQRRTAEENLGETLKAIDHSYTRVVANMLADQPRREEEQRELLELALGAYEKLERVNGHAPAVRFEVAKASQKLAEVLSLMDRRDAVAAAYRRAADAFRRLAHDFPSDPEYRRHLAQCESALGGQPGGVVRPQEAEQARSHALALREELVARWPGHAGYRCDLAESYRTIAVGLKNGGDLKGAEALIRKGLSLFDDDETGGSRDRPEVLRALSRLHDNLGNLLRKSDRLPEAAEESRTALVLRVWLREDRPRSPAARLEEARSHNNLGSVLHERRDLDGAVEHYLSAETIQRDLASEFPSVLTYRQELARTRVNLGDAYQVGRQGSDARPYYDLALGTARRLKDDFPEQPEFRHDLARTLYSLALLDAKQEGKRDEARRGLLEARELEKKLIGEQPGNLEYLELAAKIAKHLTTLQPDGP